MFKCERSEHNNIIIVKKRTTAQQTCVKMFLPYKQVEQTSVL